MRVSLNWLKQYIYFKISPEELSHQLTMLGLEVESVDYLGRRFDGFVVGEVLSVSKHPNANKLTVCKVDVRMEVLQIVCGAPNVEPGQKVVVGLVGATVPRNQHDPGGAPFTLAHVKLRGEDSFGMICSAYELDLGDEKNGILILDKQAQTGIPLAKHLGMDDIVFEVGITPNRPDAMSHIGIAREISIIVKKKVGIPSVKLKESKERSTRAARITIKDKINCPRYTARVVKNVTVGVSPDWLQKYLTAVNVRPVNNIVDITNYVMLECGQPLHAFDYDKLEGHEIIVRPAVEGEKFTTLDHKSRTLTSDTLLICDRVKPIAIAGVMGGENSEIGASTKNILIESAHFRAQSIRRTSKHFSLTTDASQRFERGADYNVTIWAADRAAQLIQQYCGGEVLAGILDAAPGKIARKKIPLRTKRVEEILGVQLNADQICKILARLEIERVGGSKKKPDPVRSLFVVPSFRPDLEREIDLIEEVARVFGYNNIQTKMEARIQFPETEPVRNLHEDLRECVIGLGYHEIVTNSMQEKEIASLSSTDVVEIANPISIEMASLRTSLVPSMLRVVRNNIFQGTKNIRLFEIGKTYTRRTSSASNSEQFVEKWRLMLCLSGSVFQHSWGQEPRSVDIFDLRGDLESLFQKIFLDKFNFIPYPTSKALSDKGLHVEINGVDSGYLGLISKELLKRFEIEQEVVALEIDLDTVAKSVGSHRKFKALSRFPSVLRDIALVVNDNISVGEIESVIRKAGGAMLTRLELFDVYSGDQLPSGKKSVAFALDLLSEDHTLTQEEIETAMESIISSARRQLNAELRG